MSAFLDCPRIEGWQALLGDTIAEPERENYERHLESCSACQERLRQIDEDEDGLRRLGRRVGDPTAAPADSTLIQVLERLHAAKALSRTMPDEPADLYFLRPSEQPGVLGLLGDYEVREVIGQGGMGVVLKAFEPALHRLVAIKVLAAALAGSATARRRFTREARAAAAVCHDHVVAVHGVSETDGLPYLVMQYVAGESLQDRLDRAGPLQVEEVVRIGLQTASGLTAAHAQGLIHRDIKPANLLLENGVARVKITDFGLARMADDVGLTQNGVVAGTPEYMAPEQARGEFVDHRADLFSLGSVLYACCTGLPPFRGSIAMAVLRQVIDEEPAPLRSLNPDVPAWLEAFIARLMAKEAAERFASAAEVAQLLEGYLAHLRQPSAVPAPEVPLLTRGTRERSLRLSWPHFANRLPLWVWISTLAALIVLGLGISFLFRPGVKSSNLVGVVPDKPPPARKDNWRKQDQVVAGLAEGKDNRRKQDHLVVDLPAGIDKLPPSLSLFGPDAQSIVKADARGWRITLPADRDNTDIVGVETTNRLSGDFAISLGYELLSVGEPWPQFGAGVWIRIWFDTPSFLSAMLSRNNSSYHNPHEQSFAAFKILKDPDGKEKYLDTVVEKAHGPRGKLRLERIGSRLHYLMVEEGPNFRTMQTVEIGTADVRKVQVFCSTMYTPTALDVRWTELDIRADKIDSQNSSLASEPLSAQEAAGGMRKGSALVVVFGFGLAITLVALIVWLLCSRRDRSAAQVPALPHGVLKRFLQRRELAALVLFALLALGIAWWFAVGTGVTDPKAGKMGEAASSPELQTRFHQDLRSADLDNSLLRPLDERVRCEAAGVRVTLPAGEGVPPSGLSTNVKIHGDFEITGSFEILKADRPSTGYGVGVSLYAAIDPKTNDSVSLAHRLMPDGKTVFVSNRMTPAKDKPKDKLKTLPSRSAVGKLRLQRVGSRLRFLVADGNQLDFVLVDEVEFSGEDVRYVQFGGNTGGSKSGLDLRLLDFTLRAERLADAADFSPDRTGDASRTAKPKKWLIALGLCVGIVLSFGAVGWWLMARQSRRAAAERIRVAVADRQEASPSAAPALYFPCSACGKRLKVKAELAGKKVKCPQCGKAVPVSLEDGFTPARQPDTVSVADAGSRTWRRGVVQRFLQHRWLAALSLVTFLGLVMVFWFAARNGGTAPKGGGGGTARQHLAFDFRAGIPNFSALSLEGPDADKVAKSDGQGLRVTLPARRKDNAPVGVVLAKRLRGDFEIIVGYELLALGKPVPQWGEGVAMRVWFHSPTLLSAMLTRYLIPAGERFVALRVPTGPDGKEQYVDYAEQGASRPRGKLRLVRQGADLHYFMAEEGQDWTQLQSVEIGTQDVERLQLLCTTMHTPIALDVRLTELVIDAEQFPSGAEPTQSPAVSRQSLPHPKPKKWLTALAVCVVIFLSLGAAVWWRLARQSRRAAAERIRAAVADRQEASPCAAPALYFPCSACGKRLKAKAELSGKKVKCPQCGQAAAVPVIDTYTAGRQP